MSNNNIGVSARQAGVTRVVHEECDVHLQVHKNTLKSALDDFLKEYFDVQNLFAWLFNLFTLALTLSTSSFHDACGIPSSVWHAVFLIAIFLVFIWVIFCIFKVIRNKDKDSAYFVNNLQKNIMNSTLPPRATEHR